MTPSSSNVEPAQAIEKLRRSHAQTPAGIKRLANSIARDAIGLPLTSRERTKHWKERPKLDPREVNRNAYVVPAFRGRSPREMPKRKPGWTLCRFVLPRRVLEGLIYLAKTKANQAQWERSRVPRGFRRRYPKTRNFYVLKGLNYVFEEFGLPEFCVQEAEVASGRVRRFKP